MINIDLKLICMTLVICVGCSNLASFLIYTEGIGKTKIPSTYMTIDKRKQEQEQENYSKPEYGRLQCVQKIENILEDSPQVFILMAAKSGGTSAKDFSIECSGLSRSHHPDNFLNHVNYHKQFLLKTLQVPQVVASHAYRDTTIIQLMEHSGQNTVFFFIYRGETDRLISGIRYVVKTKLCSPGQRHWKYFSKVPKASFNVNLNDTVCSFDEKPFVENLIQSGVAEVGFSETNLLTCNFWRVADDTGSKIYFIRHSEMDALQSVLHQQFCPDLDFRAVHSNENANNNLTYYVKTKNNQFVELNAWLEAKKKTIQFAAALNPGSCQYKTRAISEKLAICPVVELRQIVW